MKYIKIVKNKLTYENAVHELHRTNQNLDSLEENILDELKDIRFMNYQDGYIDFTLDSLVKNQIEIGTHEPKVHVKNLPTRPVQNLVTSLVKSAPLKPEDTDNSVVEEDSDDVVFNQSRNMIKESETDVASKKSEGNPENNEIITIDSLEDDEIIFIPDQKPSKTPQNPLPAPKPPQSLPPAPLQPSTPPQTPQSPTPSTPTSSLPPSCLPSLPSSVPLSTQNFLLSKLISLLTESKISQAQFDTYREKGKLREGFLRR